MNKVAVIINPNAKKFRTGKASIKRYMDYNSDNVMVSAPQNIDELKDSINKYKNFKPDYICIGGGDGTIHFVITEIINAYNSKGLPPILILREGTMNNVARSVNLKLKGPQLLDRLLKKTANNEKVEAEDRFTIKINDKYCFLFGTGCITNFLDKVYSGKEKGFFRNMQVGFMGVKEGLLNRNDGEIFNLTDQSIYIDGDEININPVIGLLSGTVEHIGMGFSPLPEAVQSSGMFQTIILGINSREILLNLNKLRVGKRIKSDKYLNVLSRSLVIKQDGDFEYTMDGDIYTAKDELNVSIGPKVSLVKI
jgi:diacylglycerol kinase family enzyme